MKIVRRPPEMAAASERLGNRTLGFVPTMGALHDGHRSLIRRARRENDRVAVSIFVNPLQFGAAEDYGRYPRPAAADIELCRTEGVDFLFHPSAAALYPAGFLTRVEVPGLSELHCGEFRPGHFRGVATVVLKLFEIVRPDRAYFGEKDYQQLAIVRRMAADLNLPVEVVGCPTVRDKDGLALSSRNAYLSPAQRRAAPSLYRALSLGAAAGRKGASVATVERIVKREISKTAGMRLEYAHVVDPGTLERPRSVRGPRRILAAVRVGRTRLIDNAAFNAILA